MKLRTIALFTLLAVAACGKVSDQPRLQEEALGLVKTYTPRVDALQRRLAELDKRGRAARSAGDPAAAMRLWSEAQAKIDQLRGLLQGMPAAVQTAAKTNNPEELEKLIDGSEARLEHDIIESNAQLDGVESWIWNAEHQTVAQAAAPGAGTGSDTGTATQPTETTGAATDGTSPPPTAAPTPPGAGSDAGRRLP